MRLLFVHQNFPGQYRHLLRHFGAEGGHELVFVTQTGKPNMPDVQKVEYTPHREPTKGIHRYLFQTEKAVINGQSVARALIPLRAQGYVPDLILGHPGWGETLFLKDLFPDAPLLSYCEFYYRSEGSDVGFDAEFQGGLDNQLRARVRAGYHLLSIEAADAGLSPTEWQKSQFPEPFQDKIRVIHDGIDTGAACPDPEAAVTLPGGLTLRHGDEVVTYVARNLEPYRGFHSFMRALPAILERRPKAQVIVVGGDEVSYGSMPRSGGTWREVLLKETGLDSPRVHFLGRVPYKTYLSILQVSTVHVYLTYPFVLSWSALEAMSAGCVLVGSDTPPVQEVIDHERNGLLVGFFDRGAIADAVCRVCEDPAAFAPMRRAARETILEQFDLQSCLKRQIALIGELAGR